MYLLCEVTGKADHFHSRIHPKILYCIFSTNHRGEFQTVTAVVGWGPEIWTISMGSNPIQAQEDRIMFSKCINTRFTFPAGDGPSGTRASREPCGYAAGNVGRLLFASTEKLPISSPRRRSRSALCWRGFRTTYSIIGVHPSHAICFNLFARVARSNPGTM
jgi:hypothetical protein